MDSSTSNEERRLLGLHKLIMLIVPILKSLFQVQSIVISSSPSRVRMMQEEGFAVVPTESKKQRTMSPTALSMSTSADTDTGAAASEHVNRRELARNSKPIPCYKVEQIPPKEGDETLYDDLAQVVEKGIATLTHELVIPAKDAHMFHVSVEV